MTRSNSKIALSSADGNPRLEKTWSGTPYNLIESLEELGVVIVPIDASLNRSGRAFCRLAQRFMGFKGYSDRGPVARFIAARRTEKQCLRAGVKRVLHTGTLDLPGTARGNGLQRHVFCDYTWDLWAGYAKDIHRFSARSARISEKLEQRAFGQAACLFPISDYVRSNLVTHYRVNPDAMTVVGTGGGKIAPFHGSKDYAKGPILFVAKERFEEKGGTLLMEGFRLANRTNPSLKLVLAGKGATGINADSMPNVTVAGHVSWEDLQRLFESAALFAMPAYCEPWGLVYLEALACKTPLLGLARNSLPELTQNGRFGFLVEEPDPKHIAQGILEAFSDPKALERMGHEGQQHCLDKYSWAKTARLIRDRMLGDLV
jgi:glycosyltransferase involved in cell wall biosynthesis